MSRRLNGSRDLMVRTDERLLLFQALHFGSRLLVAYRPGGLPSTARRAIPNIQHCSVAAPLVVPQTRKKIGAGVFQGPRLRAECPQPRFANLLKRSDAARRRYVRMSGAPRPRLTRSEDRVLDHAGCQCTPTTKPEDSNLSAKCVEGRAADARIRTRRPHRSATTSPNDHIRSACLLVGLHRRWQYLQPERDLGSSVSQKSTAMGIWPFDCLSIPRASLLTPSHAKK